MEPGCRNYTLLCGQGLPFPPYSTTTEDFAALPLDWQVRVMAMNLMYYIKMANQSYIMLVP